MLVLCQRVISISSGAGAGFCADCERASEPMGYATREASLLVCSRVA